MWYEEERIFIEMMGIIKEDNRENKITFNNKILDKEKFLSPIMKYSLYSLVTTTHQALNNFLFALEELQKITQERRKNLNSQEENKSSIKT